MKKQKKEKTRVNDRLIDPAMKKLSEMISQMGEDALTCFSLALESYLDDRKTAPQVHELSENIRKNYYNVEDQIFDIMLKYQPVAEDFRFIRSSTEISYAYSRFGIYAYDIALVRETYGGVTECVNDGLEETSTRVKKMIRDAVISFRDLDIRKAIKIQRREVKVDRIYHERIPELINSNNTKCALMETLILRYLERIADHAVFLSDAVNYIVTGKHRPVEEEISDNDK